MGVRVSRYGYRLFLVQVREGKKRQNLDFGDLHGRSYVDLVHEDVTGRLNAVVRLEDQPVPNDDGTVPPPRGSVVKFVDSQRKGSSTRLSFLHGTYGEGGVLVDPDGVRIDQDITNQAVSRAYRAVIFTYEHAESAILGVEVRGRECPKDRLAAGLKQISPVPWTLRVDSSVADAAALRNFIRNGRITELDVIRYGRSRDGDPITDDITLKVNIKGDSRLQEPLHERALAWAGTSVRRITGHRENAGEVANELARIAVGTRLDIEFDDSLIKIQGTGGRSKTLRPAKELSEWIYDLGETSLSDEKFFSAVEENADDLLPGILQAGGVTP